MSSEMREYADRDHMELDRDGNYYCRHVSAMTREGLHAKSDIAAELAWRDREIDRLRALLARTEAGADGVVDSRAAFERWAKPQGYRLHIRDTPGSARLGQYGDDSTQAAWEAWTASRTTRPQGASGDAELIEAVGTYEEAVRLFGRTSPSASRAYCRMTDVLAAMQAKEAK